MKITVSCNNWVLVNITQVIAYMKWLPLIKWLWFLDKTIILFVYRQSFPLLFFLDQRRAALKHIRHQAENLCQPSGPLKSLMLSFMF